MSYFQISDSPQNSPNNSKFYEIQEQMSNASSLQSEENINQQNRNNFKLKQSISQSPLRRQKSKKLTTKIDKQEDEHLHSQFQDFMQDFIKKKTKNIEKIKKSKEFYKQNLKKYQEQHLDSSRGKIPDNLKKEKYEIQNKIKAKKNLPNYFKFDSGNPNSSTREQIAVQKQKESLQQKNAHEKQLEIAKRKAEKIFELKQTRNIYKKQVMEENKQQSIIEQQKKLQVEQNLHGQQKHLYAPLQKNKNSSHNNLNSSRQMEHSFDNSLNDSVSYQLNNQSRKQSALETVRNKLRKNNSIIFDNDEIIEDGVYNYNDLLNMEKNELEEIERKKIQKEKLEKIQILQKKLNHNLQQNQNKEQKFENKLKIFQNVSTYINSKNLIQQISQKTQKRNTQDLINTYREEDQIKEENIETLSMIEDEKQEIIDQENQQYQNKLLQTAKNLTQKQRENEDNVTNEFFSKIIEEIDTQLEKQQQHIYDQEEHNQHLVDQEEELMLQQLKKIGLKVKLGQKDMQLLKAHEDKLQDDNQENYNSKQYEKILARSQIKILEHIIESYNSNEINTEKNEIFEQQLKHKEEEYQKQQALQESFDKSQQEEKNEEFKKKSNKVIGILTQFTKTIFNHKNPHKELNHVGTKGQQVIKKRISNEIHQQEQHIQNLQKIFLQHQDSSSNFKNMKNDIQKEQKELHNLNSPVNINNRLKKSRKITNLIKANNGLNQEDNGYQRKYIKMTSQDQSLQNIKSQKSITLNNNNNDNITYTKRLNSQHMQASENSQQLQKQGSSKQFPSLRDIMLKYNNSSPSSPNSNTKRTSSRVFVEGFERWKTLKSKYKRLQEKEEKENEQINKLKLKLKQQIMDLEEKQIKSSENLKEVISKQFPTNSKKMSVIQQAINSNVDLEKMIQDQDNCQKKIEQKKQYYFKLEEISKPSLIKDNKQKSTHLPKSPNSNHYLKPKSTIAKSFQTSRNTSFFHDQSRLQSPINSNQTLQIIQSQQQQQLQQNQTKNKFLSPTNSIQSLKSQEKIQYAPRPLLSPQSNTTISFKNQFKQMLSPKQNTKSTSNLPNILSPNTTISNINKDHITSDNNNNESQNSIKNKKDIPQLKIQKGLKINQFLNKKDSIDNLDNINFNSPLQKQNSIKNIVNQTYKKNQNQQRTSIQLNSFALKQKKSSSNINDIVQQIIAPQNKQKQDLQKYSMAKKQNRNYKKQIKNMLKNIEQTMDNEEYNSEDMKHQIDDAQNEIRNQIHIEEKQKILTALRDVSVNNKSNFNFKNTKKNQRNLI